MTRQFILAFGGTGARCAEAVAYLLASRAISGSTQVLLLDPDGVNGNVDDARSQLERYHSLHARLKSQTAASADPPFFSTPVNAETGARSFFWQHPSGSEPFRELVHLTQLDTEQRGLMELLYDQGDMDLSFENGYVGRAHLGSFDLLRTLRPAVRNAAEQAEKKEVPVPDDALQQFFSKLRAASQDKGAKLLVLGSVFGGTGASGLPAVPPLLDDYFVNDAGARKKVRTACVLMTPYFTFPSGGDEDPNSAQHPLATQTSLRHYASGASGYDRVYAVGAPGRPETSEANERGGAAQHNRAHYAELGAALAVRHFFDGPIADEDTDVYLCGSKQVSWAKLPAGGARSVEADLVALGAMALLHVGYLHDDLLAKRHLGARWMHDLVGAEGQRRLDPVRDLGSLYDFCARYLRWLRDVQRAGTDVQLFGLDATRPDPARIEVEDLARITHGTPVAAGGAGAYHLLMKALNGGHRHDQQDGVGWYVAALTHAADALRRDRRGYGL